MLDENRVAVLNSVCDTIVPSLHREDDPTGFWARSAADTGANQAVAQAISEMPETDQAGMAELLDSLELQNFSSLSQASREQILTNTSLASREAAIGVGALTQLTLFFHYGLPPNTNWEQFNFPGPISPPPEVEKPIRPLTPSDGDVLEADAVVVGSGAGGGVIAARLAEAGLKVIVLEMGGYFNEADFDQTELNGFARMYWRGGPTYTADFNVSLQAGSCLGGGTLINWTNCLKPKPWVRQEWADEYGLEDVNTPDFDRHIDSVWERIMVNRECSELNQTQKTWIDASEKLGWAWHPTDRNWDRAKHDPAMAGYMGWGDQSGAKQSTLKTYLEDATRNGADVIVGCQAKKILVEDGRAAGIEADFGGAGITIRSPRVVVAGGALESPALLLRSGIGGPATGKHLRLHPCTLIFATYPDDQQAWWGPPHAAVVNEFENGLEDDGYGFLIEGAQYTTGLGGSAIPFTTAEQHREVLAGYANGSITINLTRERGGGQVLIDGDGQSMPIYSLDDPRDVANMHFGLEQQVRLHRAAGANQIFALAQGMPGWRIGDDFDAFLGRINRIPLRAGGAKLFAAHQMGSCRMGKDPADSVADPRGELHDLPGVWIGDGSAFPTPSGTNPMITIMALASRTAEKILEDAGAGGQTASKTVEAGA
ncbi:MAG TPA: GMC family oxidoreductase [Solirubrobacterales bacterium]|nr:GMC family oxidoreductase [Solirubrobacterales bacterium]